MIIVNFQMTETINSTSMQNSNQSFDTRKELILKGTIVQFLCNKITNLVNAANKVTGANILRHTVYSKTAYSVLIALMKTIRPSKWICKILCWMNFTYYRTAGSDLKLRKWQKKLSPKKLFALTRESPFTCNIYFFTFHYAKATRKTQEP